MTVWSSPAHLPALGPDEIHVWKASVAELASREAAFSALLDPREQARGARFRQQADRLRYAISHGLLRTLAGHYLGRVPTEVCFGEGTHGKPHVSGRDHGHLAFSLSHSGDAVLIALARRGNVGVDVESWNERLDERAMHRITESVFSTREGAALKQMAAEQRRAAFYAVWSRKEAYIKATGLGLSQGLAHFDVSPEPGEARLLADRNHDAAGWVLHDLDPGPGYSAALAVNDVSLAPIAMHATSTIIGRR